MISERKASLSEKDKAFREFTLSENMWRVVLQVGTPLALYQSLTQMFEIFDTMMAPRISTTAVSAVAYLSQLNMMLSALGDDLAIGASIQISAAYGAGSFELVKRRTNTLFAMYEILGITLLAVPIPLTPQFLRLARTPKEFISTGTTYFILELFDMVVSFSNNVYIAIERARGNSKGVLYSNLVVLGVKLALTALFAYVLDGDTNIISAATIISQTLLLLAAVKNLNEKGNTFGFLLKGISLTTRVTTPMIRLSIPVIVEEMAFSFGKVVINSMSTVCSTLTMGTLGISNNIDGFSTNLQNGFQEGTAAIISQNLGAEKVYQALQAFGCVLMINVIVGGVFVSLSPLFLSQISGLFTGNDADFSRMIASIYRVEAMGTIPLDINAAVMALLYGFGKAKLTLLISFSRVLFFRVPVSQFLQQYTDLGEVNVGVMVAVGNIATGTLTVVVGGVVIIRICRQDHVALWKHGERVPC